MTNGEKLEKRSTFLGFILLALTLGQFVCVVRFPDTRTACFFGSAVTAALATSCFMMSISRWADKESKMKDDVILRDRRLTHEELEILLAEALGLMAEIAHRVPYIDAYTERFMTLRDRVAWRG